MHTAIRALPRDHGTASDGMTSTRLVGLDCGSRIGRSTPAHTAVTTASVKAPCVVEVPMRIVGLTCWTTVSRSISPSAQPLTSPRGRA